MTDIRLEGVSFDYPDGTRALSGVDLHIAAGQSVAFIGANGSGKSTLVRHLNGLLHPTVGRVLVGGTDARERRVAALATDVGLCFQNPEQQIFSSNVRDEVEFGAKQLGVPSEDAFLRAKEAVALVGLGEDLGKHPADLGETGRRLLTIASVLAMRTPVVVLDEPTTGLDTAGIDRIEDVVAGLHADGRTVITVSHDMRFVAETSKRVVLLDGGAVALDASPDAVFAAATWPTLRTSGLEPPEAARLGERLGLGTTPSAASLVEALLTAQRA